MLEKPTIPEPLITACLLQDFGIRTADITFLPLGYDIHTAVYRVDAQDSNPFFLKLRKGAFNPISVEIPSILSSQGIKAIIAPIKTLTGQLYGKLEEYTTIVYPYISGTNGYESKLSDSQWIELGRTLRQVHSAQLPLDALSSIPREAYDASCRVDVRRFLTDIYMHSYDDAVAQKTAEFLKDKHPVILNMLQRAEKLALFLSRQPGEYVLCHTDAHPGNLHLTDQGDLYLVDWDNPTCAPRERDLMFVGAGMCGDQPGGDEEALFYQGYGRVEINQSALVYYRFERILQDIAEFSKQLLLTSQGGDDREQAYFYLTHSFTASREVEAALLTDQRSGLI